jgi:hypothetical protein
MNDHIFTCEVKQLRIVLEAYFNNNVAIQQLYNDILGEFKVTLDDMTWAVRDALNTNEEDIQLTARYLNRRQRTRGRYDAESKDFHGVVQGLRELGVVSRVQKGSWKFGNGDQFPDPLMNIHPC